MGLLEVLTGRATKAASEATVTLRELARKEAEGTASKADAAALEKALQAAGRTPKDFEKLVTLHQRAAELKAQADGVEAHGRKLADLRRQEHKTREELETATAKLTARLANIAGEIRETIYHLERAQRAERDLQELEFLNPDLRGAALPDFDTLTLTTGPSADPLPIRDDAAPTLQVPRDVWNREHDRRRFIIGSAHREAMAAWQEQVKQWNEEQASPSRWRELVDMPKPVPIKPDVPTWADLVASGYAAKFPREDGR